MEKLGIKDLLKGKEGRKAEKEQEAPSGRAERAPWFSYRMQVPSARAVRRIREADAKRNARRYRKQQVQAYFERERHNGRIVVGAVRDIEFELGLEPGGFVDLLVAEGALPAGQRSYSTAEIAAASERVHDAIAEREEALAR